MEQAYIENEDVIIRRYKVSITINEEESIIRITDNIDGARKCYEELRDLLLATNINPYIISLYDYDKDSFIEYYDNTKEQV